jgi:hypothetical protein
VGGYFPKFSLDGQSLSYWSQESIWTVGLHGANPRRVGTVGVPQPTPSAWVNGSPKTYLDPAVHAGKTIWPGFDVLPDGRMLTAPINIHETALWTVNLTYVDKND